MRTLLAVLLLTATVRPGSADVPRVRDILARFEAARPDEKSLGFYSLDWAMNLAEARERARREKRPILLILNTNITAGTNFFTGHT